MASPVAQTQLVTGGGEIGGELDGFVSATSLASWGVGYQVVAIMGPQSSGKSTLLNHLFGTKFTEMDALAGRGQTTQVRAQSRLRAPATPQLTRASASLSLPRRTGHLAGAGAHRA